MSDTNLAPAGLSASQQSFLKLMIEGESIKDSAIKSGYTPAAGYAILHMPAARALIETALHHKLSTEAAPLAIRTLIYLVKNGSERIQVDASKILLDRAGFVPPTRLASDGDTEKQLTEMSQDELHDVMSKHEKEIDRLEAELAARATQVNAPIQSTLPQESSNLLD